MPLYRFGLKLKNNRGRTGENMTAKEYLEQVKHKQVEIENLRRDKESLHQMMYGLGSYGYSEKVQTSRENDKFGTLYSKLDLLDRQIADHIIEFLEFKSKVSGEINALEDMRFMVLLNCRYLHFQTWETIAEKAYTHPYNVRHVQKLHGLALKAFQEQYKTMLDKCDIREHEVIKQNGKN